MQDQEYVLKIASALFEKKAMDIVVLRVSHLTVLCDYMAGDGLRLRRSEGQSEGRWAVLDYGHILVHLFHREERAYYGLERLWNDGTNQLELPFDQTAD